MYPRPASAAVGGIRDSQSLTNLREEEKNNFFFLYNNQEWRYNTIFFSFLFILVIKTVLYSQPSLNHPPIERGIGKPDR